MSENPNNPTRIPSWPRPPGETRGKVAAGDNLTFFRPDGNPVVYMIGSRMGPISLNRGYRINETDRRAWRRLAGWKATDLRATLKAEKDRMEAQRVEYGVAGAKALLAKHGYKVTKPRAKK